jgi:hypothetical protein
MAFSRVCFQAVACHSIHSSSIEIRVESTHGGKKIEPSRFSVQVSITITLLDAQTMTFDNSQRMRTQEDVIGSFLRDE